MKTPFSHKKRLFFILVFFTLFAFLLAGRVAWIQIVQGADLSRQASDQQNIAREINPKRGTIMDRNGNTLAVSASVETISVNPQELEDRYTYEKIDIIANGLADLLTMTEKERTSLLTKIHKNSRYEIIKSKVDKDVGTKVRNWLNEKEYSGINVDEDYKRFYPKANLAAQVIGFTSADNIGLDGIEKQYEEYLKGTKGKILSEVDVLGRPLPFASEEKIDATDGLNVVLTIDETIQYLAQKALETAVSDSKVLEGAAAIVADPRTGDILAMVSLPDFDLNSPWAAPAGQDPATWSGTSATSVALLQKTVWRNKAISDSYEPGSTFKAITTSAGLEEGVVTPETRVNDRTVVVSGKEINCWQPNQHGDESFTEAVYNSCNPVFVAVAQQLGIQRFYKYVKAFGFMDKTNISLYGEAQSIFHQSPTVLDMSVASFGQRFQITPIQLISAYNAIANGGQLIKPQLVKELTDAQGNVVKKFEPEVIRNVISKQTSDTVKKILEGVVAYGTGHNAYVRGYRLAGKTGTSETLQTDTTGRYVASFITFAPADDPVVSLLIMLDHPDVYPNTGGYVAAPIAGKLMEDILNYLGVERRYTESDKASMLLPTNVPDVIGKTVDEARQILSNYKLQYKVEGDTENKNAIVMAQTPGVYAEVLEKSVVILYTYKPEKEVTVLVPDLINMNMDEAILTLNDIGLNIKISGVGNVISQSVPYGTAVPKGSLIDVELRDLNVH